MINEQDLEDLKLLKVLQKSEEWNEYKALKNDFSHTMEEVLSIINGFHSIMNDLMRAIQHLSDLTKRDEELRIEILKMIEE